MIGEEWKGMENKIKEMRKMEEKKWSDKGDKREGRGWWDKECMKKTKEVRRKLREWKEKRGIEEYTGKRRRIIKSYVIGK